MTHMISVESAGVDAIGYNPLTLELYVEVPKTEKTFVFQPVEEARYEEFLRVDRKSEYLIYEMKSNYECEEV